MTNERGNSHAGHERTRRNIIKMGAILVPAILGTVHPATAKGLGSSGNSSLLGDLLSGLSDLLGSLLGGSRNNPRTGSSNCFLKGTTIRTADGERPIEDLNAGDLLPTMFGGLRPVQWIGRYRFKKSDPSKAWVEDALPIRIGRSALAPNVPRTDLYLTPLHSVLLDGVLVPAELLINGATITRHQPEGDELELFHIKLEGHDVVYAEGAPVETLLKVEESAVNFAEYFRQYGTPEREEARCAPYVHSRGGRYELMSRARSALSPWIDLRDRADVFRDRLEEGADAQV
jgi:Hint domain